MRRTALVLLCGLLICGAAAAQAPQLGVGVFGGLNIPIAQEDEGSGKIFGIMGRIKLSFLAVEPNIAFMNYGDPDPIDGIDLGEGSDLTSYGIDVTFGGAPGGIGFKPFLVAGIASYKMKNDLRHVDESKVGYSGGLGFLFGFTPRLDLNVRGKLHVIPIDGGGSRKSAGLTGGLVLNF